MDRQAYIKQREIIKVQYITGELKLSMNSFLHAVTWAQCVSLKKKNPIEINPTNPKNLNAFPMLRDNKNKSSQ